MGECEDAPTTGLTRAPHVLPEIRERLATEVPEHTMALARACCERYDSVDGEALPRAPRSIAAGALYLAADLTGVGCTQAAIADAAGVSALSTRQAYQDLAVRAGVATEAETGVTLTDPAEYPAWVRASLEGEHD